MSVAGQASEAEQAGAFLGRAIGDIASTYTVMCCSLGDRFGLFKDLAAHGPHTGQELADCAKLSERYVREWASCLVVSGYLVYDPKTARFSLPPAHASVLAQEPGPFFIGGLFQQIGALLPLYEPLAQAFKDGRGISPSLYGPDVWKGEMRGNDMWHNQLLVNEWMPKMPDVKQRLERGASLADIGCGGGRALVRIAQAFSKSTFVGFDIDPPSLERARALAAEEGVGDRVRFEQLDLTKGIPGKFDILTAFDVVHDTAHPFGVLESVRKALKPGGLFVLLEINGTDKLEDNVAPFGTVFYGWSLLMCMSIAIARGGEGLGTPGLPEGKLREMASRAGFSSLRRVEINDPIQALFELRA
jgi:SAM-dependent methyltransferase